MKIINEAVTTAEEAVEYLESSAPMCIDACECTGNCWEEP